MGKAYTRAIIEACIYVDEFIDVEDFLHKNVSICREKPVAIVHVFPVSSIARRAKQLKIPLRIGTTNRIYHWLTCNRLVKVSRKKSHLHEAQLNLKLLEVFNIKVDFSPEEIGHFFGLKKLQALKPRLASLIQHGKYNLILHPKSQGNGREWPMENFIQLIRLLDKEKYEVFISGTQKEQRALQPLFEAVGNMVTDVTGKMSLEQFISFINQCDGLVASGTGPIHIAAALGKDAFGIYPPIRCFVKDLSWRGLFHFLKLFRLTGGCLTCLHFMVA